MWGEGFQQLSDPIAQRVFGSFGGFSKQGLELCKGHLDRVEIGGIGRQVEQPRASGFDDLPHPLDLVCREIVHE